MEWVSEDRGTIQTKPFWCAGQPELRGAGCYQLKGLWWHSPFRPSEHKVWMHVREETLVRGPRRCICSHLGVGPHAIPRRRRRAPPALLMAFHSDGHRGFRFPSRLAETRAGVPPRAAPQRSESGRRGPDANAPVQGTGGNLQYAPKHTLHYAPQGVVDGVTSWNSPLATVGGKPTPTLTTRNPRRGLPLQLRTLAY